MRNKTRTGKRIEEELIFVSTTPLVLVGLCIMERLRLQLVNKNVKNNEILFLCFQLQAPLQLMLQAFKLHPEGYKSSGIYQKRRTGTASYGDSRLCFTGKL